MKKVMYTIGGIVIGLVSLASGANAAPAGFEIQTVVTGLNLATDFEYAPDGRIFFVEKGGTVRIFKDELLPTPFYTVTDVNDYWDRGLVGIALDPNFEINGYVYLAYTYENDTANYEGPKTARVVRVTASGDVAIPGSELVLLGTEGGSSTRPSCEDFPTNTDCIPSDGPSHSIDALEFGADGMLYVSVGDSAAFDGVDALAHRVSDITSFAGKVIRINPANGEGLTDNPHYTGNVNDNASKVYAQGFRNPFRMSFRPATDALYVGDVGWYSYEEVNVITPGLDYGWPCREGLVANPGGYPAAGFSCGAATSYADPLYDYAHDPETGAGSITAGVFYGGSSYPSEYNDTLFIGDFAQDFIKRIIVDGSDTFVSVEDFHEGAGGAVAFGSDLNGDINYISIYTGELRRIVYTGGNVAPNAVASADTTSGDAPLEVFFSSNGSSDPDGDPISFEWDFGDGSAVSNLSNPTHTYTVDGSYTATLTVTDTSGAVNQDTIVVTVGNHAPVAVIALPDNGDLYTPLQTINLLAIGSDEEDGVISADAQFDWTILIHHNIHFHTLMTMTGVNPSFLAPSHGDDDETVHLEIQLTVTDSQGLVSEMDSIRMYIDSNAGINPTHTNSIVNPLGSSVGTPITITSTITNTGNSGTALVDIELFNSSNEQVAQAFYDASTLDSGVATDFTLDFTPTVADTYRVAVGLIEDGWGGLYEWTNDALSFAVTGGGGGNTAPVITVTGANPLNLTVGDTYTDPGATATDSEDGDLTGSIIVGGDTVDTNTVGTYTVTYNVTDSGGLSATEQNRTVIVANSGSWTPTPPNGATFFDGVDDYIDTEFWDIEEPIGFTLEARFAADSFNGDVAFIGKTDGATGTPAIDWMFGLREVSPTEAELLYIITSGGTTETLTGGSIPLGTMVQASAVYDNTDMILYVDGVEVARTPKTGLIAQDITHQVMVGNLPGATDGYGFHGVFDEVRVWNEPQSAAEILEFQGELTQKELGLIKDWRFNEGFGQVVIDRSNSGHHGHLGSVHGAVDGNDPSFLGGVYPAGGTFAPVHNGTTALPNPVEPNVPTTISVEIENTGDGAGFMIINVEVYDSSETQVFQTFVDGEGFFAGETRTFDFEFTPTTEGDYRVAVGLVHLFWADVYEWVNDAMTLTVSNTITDPVVTVIKSNDVPSQNIVAGAANQPLSGFEVNVTNTPVEVSAMTFNLAFTDDDLGGELNGADVTNLVLVNESGVVVAGPVAAVDAGTNAGTVTFTDTFTLPVGSSVYTVRGTLGTDFENDDTIDITTTPSGDWTLNTTVSSITTTNVEGNTMYVKDTYTVMRVSTTPAAQNIVAGTSQFTFANMQFDASQSGEDVRFNAAEFHYTKTSSEDITNCRAYDDETLLNTTAINPTLPGGAHNFIFDENALIVPKGTIKTVSVRCDIPGSVGAGSTFSWGINTIDIIEGTGLLTGTSVNALQDATTNVGPTMTVSSGGSGPFTLDIQATATALPNTPTPAQPVTITVPVTNTGDAGTGVVNIEIYSGGVQVHQEIFEDEAFGTGETRNFVTNYTPTTEGVYAVSAGLYEQYWAGFFGWFSNVAVFTAANEGGAPGAQVIYDDTLAAGFANWGWDTTVDLASTAVTPSQGSNSIENTYTAEWGGLYLHHDAFDTTGETILSFDIHGGATGGQTLQVIALDSAGSIVAQVPINTYISSPQAGSWSTVTIPLVDLGVVDTIIGGFIFQGASGATEATYYLDNIIVD